MFNFRSLTVPAGVAALALAVTTFLPEAHSAAAPGNRVDWLAAAADADIDRSFAMARTQNKPVLLYWGATWCPPCNQLKATLFNRQDFIAASRSFVAVHVDGDRPGAQRLGARFKVSGYPSVVLLSANGTEITRLPGEVDPEQMMAVLQLGMAGGRPVKAVLADAKAGKSLTEGEWRMLAFYAWDLDEQQLIPKADHPDLLAQLAVASSSATAETQTRLWLKAIAAANGTQGVKADASLRDRVSRVLADPAAARLHADIVTGNAAAIVRTLSDDESAERTALVLAYDLALRRLEADLSLSRGDRMGALISRIALARLGLPRDAVQVNLPDGLKQEVRDHVGRADREITDGYERQAVITAGAYALGFAGLWDDSNALLKSNLARSHSAYYLMSQLGGNARKLGRSDEALGWYEQAWRKSQGPATRLQWGSSYLTALVELAPTQVDRIEKTAAAMIADAGKDNGAFEGRSARSMQRLSKQLTAWNEAGRHESVLRRLRLQMQSVCGKVDPASSQRTACQALLVPPSKST